MYKILVAIDGSDHSQRVARYAARRAHDAPCEVDLLHVQKPVMAWEVGPVSSSEVVSDMHAIRGKQVLDVGAASFERPTKVERYTVTGEPAAAILDEAARLAVDEIIIGSHGFRAFDTTKLGSVAYKVLHDAKVPVVVVR